MPTANDVWTADRVRNELVRVDRAWPRYEFVDGAVLVTPAPRSPHQIAVAWLLQEIGPHTRRHGLGLTLPSPADIDFDGTSIVQPDVFVIPAAQSRAPFTWRDVSALLLAIEIVSPGSERHDRVRKRKHYQKHRVPEYWIVDLDARLVERWRPDDERPEIVLDAITWAPTDAVPPITLDLAALYVECCGPLIDDESLG